MVAPFVAIDTDPTFVLISWTELSEATNGGIGILGYRIEIQTNDPLVYAESSDCVGTEADILTNLVCRIPMASLLEVPFNLE